MYKKSKILIVLTIIGMLCFNMNVRAASYDIIINESIGGGSSSSGIINDAYSKGAFINDTLIGIRVTLVDKNGKRIGDTIDYYQPQSGKSLGISGSVEHKIGNSYKKQVLNGAFGMSAGYNNVRYIVECKTKAECVSNGLPGFDDKWKITQSVDNGSFEQGFGKITGYFTAIVDEFKNKIEEIKNASIDEKIKALSETNLGILMSIHGYEWKKESIEEFCTEKQSGEIYITYEPILNILVGNKYAFKDEKIDFNNTISQKTLKAYADIKSKDLFAKTNCTKTNSEITCSGLEASYIDNFLNNYYNNSSLAFIDQYGDGTKYNIFHPKQDITNYLKDLSNSIKNTGQKTFTAKFNNNEDEALAKALSIIYYVTVMKEQSDKALKNRKYFTGTITEIVEYVSNLEKYEGKGYTFYNIIIKDTVDSFLWMQNTLDGFYFGVGSSNVLWSKMLTSSGNGINAIQIYTKQSAICGNKCIVKEISGEVSKVYFNSEEMTEKNNKCCYVSGYDSQEDYDKVKKSLWYTTTCTEATTYCSVSKITEADKTCCYDLNAYSPEDKEIISGYNNLLDYIKNVNQSKYNICNPNPPGGIPCRYSVETQCPNCQTKNEGAIYDSVNNEIATDYDLSDTDLDCIFRNPTYSTGLGNSRYCPVSCVESVKYDLPQDNKTFNAGRYITVGKDDEGNYGSFSPIELSNEKVCRIAYVDYDLFESDLSKTNNDLYIAYQRYLIEKQQSISTSARTCVNSTKRFDCCLHEKRNCSTYAAGVDKDGNTIWRTSCGPYYCATPSNLKRMTLYVTYPSNSYGITNDSYTQEGYDSELDSWTRAKTSEIKQRIPNRLSLVKTLDTELRGIVNAYNRCFSVKDRMEISPFEPEVNLTYRHGSYSIYNLNLVKNESSGITSLNDATTLKTKWTLNSFNASSETLTTYPYNQYKFIGEAKRIIYSALKETDFRLPTEGVYISVDKQTGVSQMTNLPTTTYIGPHLPVKYDSTSADNNLELDILTLGSGNKFDSKFSMECDTYKCKFNVNQSIIDCPPGRVCDSGLNVVYRPISLSNPFPDESGSGRQTGKNWCAEDDCSKNNSVVQDVILNNRGVSGEDIYFSLDPLYSVILTPADIRWIREYNEGRDYTDFSLRKVTTEEGEKWYSEFLEQLNVTGCAYRNYNGRCREGDVY